MGNAPGKTSGKSGSGGDDQSPFGLINEEAFARVIRYLSIKDYVNLSSLNTRIVKSFGSNNYYWAHVCQAATEPSTDGPAKIPLSLPKLISKMYPGKKLTINGKGIHEYDYLNVSDKNVVKNFNFREVIVKYFLRWVHFPKLETQCELYSKKTNALLIIQVADFTEKWEKYWTKKDPKTYKCATDYCYVVDFQVDPQRLEALKATNPETKGKKLPEEINGRIVLYARSNVQPREDKFKSPINMYESFMRKENPQGQDNSTTGEMDLVFSPRAVTQPGQNPLPNQVTITPPTSPTGQSGLKTSGGSQPNATNNMKSPGSLKNLGQVNHASPKLPPITTVAANGTATTTAQTNGDAETTATSPITVTVTTPPPLSTPSSTDSTTIAGGSAPHSLHTPSIMTSDVPRKKDSLPLLRTTRNWSASKPNDKQRSSSSVTLSISGETKRYSKVLDVKDPPQDEVDSTPEVPLTQYNQVQDTQPLQQSTEVVPDVEIERPDEATPELPDEGTVPEIPQIDEPEIEPEVDIQQTAQNEWSDVNGGAVNDVIVQQPETTVDVQPTNTGDVVATDTTTSINMNPNETEHGDDETELLYELRNGQKEVERKQQQPIPQHADIDMDSTIAPFSMVQQQNMGINYNNISAPMTVQQPTPTPVHTSTPVVTPTPTPASEVQQQPPKSDSPFTAASNTLTTSNDEVRPPGRRTSVSDLPLFKRYAIAGGPVKNNNGGANSSPQSSPGLGRRQSQSLETTVEQKVEVEIKVEQPEVQITPVEPASEPIVEQEQSSIETGLSVPKTVTLARPSGGAAMLEDPVLNVVTPPQPTVHLTPSGNTQGGDVPLRVPSLDYPPSQPPKRQPSRPVSIDPPSRPLARPPQPYADATTPTGTPPNISLGSPKMSQKLGPKQPLSRPSTPPPQPKVGVQTRPQTPPPRPPQQSTEQPSETLPSQPPKQPMQQPPQNSPPQPKISVQMRPQPKQPSQQPPQNSPPQPQNITRPKPQEDDRFAEPLMETFRPVPPKPWKALGVRKNDTEN